MLHYLIPKHVGLRQEQKLSEIISEFETLRGFPQVVGAIDGTHIPILKSQESSSDYYNRKGFYCILMQAVVSFSGYFLDVNIGWPGKVYDTRIIANSSLYHKANKGELFPDWKSTFNGVEVPVVLLGDPAYPLLPQLMKPYPESSAMTPQRAQFSYHLTRARMVVEDAFRRLREDGDVC